MAVAPKKPRGRPKNTAKAPRIRPILKIGEAADSKPDATGKLPKLKGRPSTARKAMMALMEKETKFVPEPITGQGRGSTESWYEPRICEDAIRYMGQGYTISAFAAQLRVTKETLYKWGRQNPEFVEAIKIARLACQSFWEEQLNEVSRAGMHNSGRVAAIQFALKNLGKDDWTDSKVVEHTGTIGHKVDGTRDFSKLSTAELLHLEHLASKTEIAQDDD